MQFIRRAQGSILARSLSGRLHRLPSGFARPARPRLPVHSANRRGSEQALNHDRLAQRFQDRHNFPTTHSLTPYAQLVLYAWKLGRPNPTVGPSPQFPTPRSHSTHPLRLGVVGALSWRSIPKAGPLIIFVAVGERLLVAPPLSRSRGGGCSSPPLSWRGGLGPRNSPLPLSSSSSSGASSSAETASDVSSSSPAATITGDDVVL